jgi:transposase
MRVKYRRYWEKLSNLDACRKKGSLKRLHEYACPLSQQVDVPQATLSKWLRQAGAAAANVFPNDPNRSPPVNAMAPRRPEDWPAEEKLKTVLAAVSLSDEELGAFLRRKGLHETHLQRWRQQMIDGLQQKPPSKTARSHPGDIKRIRALEKELTRKDQALAETAALLVLKKKSSRSGGTRTRT